jgi:hypothetical protein
VWRREDALNQPQFVGPDDPHGREILGRVRRLSEALGTTLTPAGDELMVWCR